MKKLLLVCLFLSSTHLLLKAAHVYGGLMTYTCQGMNASQSAMVYEFTIKVYRNCADVDVGFDSSNQPNSMEGYVAIYRVTSANFVFLTSNSNLPRPLIQDVVADSLSNPCIEIPDDLCVQEATYTFTRELPLITSGSYHIVYQRCCRLFSISNIYNPGGSGATYSVEITAASQALCNNSPVLNNVRPVFLCANEAISYDHSATDADGDQLVYHFYRPLNGGGSGSQNPNPAAPPPYFSVGFIPPYSGEQPLLGNPMVKIDSMTGIISGTPTVVGQFVLGVAVREYRNGVFLGEIRQDFQLDVMNCQPLVKAEVEADELGAASEYIIRSCGSREVTVVNQSFQRDLIDEFVWEMMIDGQLIRNSSDWNPTFVFPDTGRYNGQLILNPTVTCGDTARITIEVLPDLNVDFDLAYDTCEAGPIQFLDGSVSQGGEIVNWFWNFADGNTSGQQDPEHRFLEPDRYPVTLQVRDSNNCIATQEKMVEWFPRAPFVWVEPNTLEGCAELPVSFENLTTLVNDAYDILWRFGDGQTSSELSPIHVYQTPGDYDVSIEIVSPQGCRNDTTWENWIKVIPKPTADFSYAPEEIFSFNPEVQFTDQSSDASSWEWTFDNLIKRFDVSPVYTFPDTGLTEVQLVVTHLSGCTDTLIQLVDIIPGITYFLPNAFTPNEDSVNDFFGGTGVFGGLNDFQLTVWNRWGEVVFQTKDPQTAWNGRKDNTGRKASNGVYVYRVTFKDPRGRPNTREGFVTLIR